MYKWLLENLGKHPFLAYDKFAHGWLHTIIVRGLRSLNVRNAFIIAVVFGIAYEILDYTVQVIRSEYDEKVMKEYAYDSLYDLVWNFIGQVVGLII